RHNLVHHSAAVRRAIALIAGKKGGAEQAVGGGIEHEPAERMHSVRTSHKSVDHRQVFVHIQLEHRPITGEADFIKVAGGITRQRIRTASPVPARKVEEYGLIPSRTQLENRPELRSATVSRAAIKISQPIGNQPRLRATAVCPSTEAVDD